MARFVVLGAGVSGLTSAVCLAEAGHDVEVWSPLDPLDTTSVVAAALWEASDQEPAQRTVGWARESYERFAPLASDAGSGVRMQRVVYGGAPMPVGERPDSLAVIRELRPSRPDELPATEHTGVTVEVPMIDMPVYLRYLQQRLITAGGRLMRRAVGTIGEAGPRVVNCTGLASRELVGDTSVQAEFGQHVEVSNPGLTTVFTGAGPANDDWVSWYPFDDRVILGGVRRAGREDATPSPEITEQILARVYEVEPRLRDCTVLRVRAGLRPFRPEVRVERESLDDVDVVHNYGHGWAGITLSWGCARDVLDLCSEVVS